MKCDELKPITVTDECGSYRVYNKSEVDAAIAELKQKLQTSAYLAQSRCKKTMLLPNSRRNLRMLVCVSADCVGRCTRLSLIGHITEYL